MNTSIKRAATLPLLCAYLFTSCLISVLPASGTVRRTLRIQNTSFFSRCMLLLFGIRVQLKHAERLRGPGGRLVVSNHLSYIDVLVISSLMPSAFITSVELKRSFFLGALARFGGCLFVERRKPSGLKQEIEDIGRVLARGFSVVLFPEGTTSNGDRVHTFKNSLFEAAVSERAVILPLCLRYTRINGADVDTDNRDSIFYYGGATFFRHLARLVVLDSVEVEVHPLKTIKVGARTSRKELAAASFALISSAYRHRMKG